MRRLALFASAACCLIPTAAHAQDAEEEPEKDSTFALGQIIVTAEVPVGIAIRGETLTAEAIYAFNRNTLDDAVNLLPGVRNAFDENFALTDGFPEPGRSFFVSARLQF